MRTLPDPLTCSTGCFSPSVDVPKALIRSDIWFPDGNIVLVAGSAAFKVHLGQLERHSEVFKDMFLVGRASIRPTIPGTYDEDTANEEGNNTVDGCPAVDIYDCPSDVYHLLVALYDGFYFSKPHARDFAALASVLRLSAKYFIEHLRVQCLARLAHDWPTTLADWDKREAAATDASGRYTPRDAYAHPVLAINLALELGIPEVLPSAFYDLSRYGPSRILLGARALPPVFAAPDPCTWRGTTGETAVEDRDGGGTRRRRPARDGDGAGPAPSRAQGSAATLPMIRLSHDCLVRTLRGRELAQLYISTFLARALEHHPSAACLYSTRAAAAAAASVGGGGSSHSHSHSPSPTSTSAAGGPGASASSMESVPSMNSIPTVVATTTTAMATASSSVAHCIESFYFIHLNVLRSVGGIACGRDADPLYTLVQAAEMLERKDFSDGVRTCGLKMCGACKREWKAEVGRAREEVWGLIPIWFGLRDGGAMGQPLADGDAIEDDEGTDVDVDVDVDELED